MSEKKFNIHPAESAEKKFNIRNAWHPDDFPLSQVEPIEERGISVQGSEDLKEVVESPLLEACQILYEKGIRTIMSSANKKDLSVGEVYIIIDHDTLSPENKKLAESMGKLHTTHGSIPTKAVKISIPIVGTTVGDVRKSAIKIALTFKRQD